MNKQTINIASGIKYLSEVFNELPKGLLNKCRCGAGGTFVAITDNNPYIIAVPYVSMIDNKCNQHSNLIGIYGGFDFTNLSELLHKNSVPKLMVTYDSLPKIIDYLLDLGINVYKEFKLLIDEYHLLFTQYSFRSEAIKKVLEIYKKFDYYTFITATPIEEDFILEELKDEDITECIWEDNQTITIESIKCNNDVQSTIIALIERFINNEIVGNAYIFVNSVDFIQSTIFKINKSKLGIKLDETNTKVIISKHNKKHRIAKKLLKTIDDPIRKINFLTSTVWEGSDIYDEDGKVYIVSDSAKKHTLVDISTSFQQIAGRIRNTKYWSKIHHILTETRYSDVSSYEEFKELSEKEIVRSKRLSTKFNDSDEEVRPHISTEETPYISKETSNYFYVDSNLIRLDLYQYKLVSCTYSVQANIIKEYQKYSYNSEITDDSDYVPSEVINVEILPDTLKEVVEKLKLTYPIDITKPLLRDDGDFHYLAFRKYPYLKLIIDELGYDYIEKENYIHTNLKNKAIRLFTPKQKEQIKKLLDHYIRPNTFYNTTQIYYFFHQVYEKLGINIKPKGTDILKYYKAESKTVRKNGEVVRGFFIFL
jgi:hypothetical protein